MKPTFTYSRLIKHSPLIHLLKLIFPLGRSLTTLAAPTFALDIQLLYCLSPRQVLGSPLDSSTPQKELFTHFLPMGVWSERLKTIPHSYFCGHSPMTFQISEIKEPICLGPLQGTYHRKGTHLPFTPPSAPVWLIWKRPRSDSPAQPTIHT